MSLNTVSVELDKPRSLRFDLGSLLTLQTRLADKSILHILERIDQVDAEAITVGYWIGLGGDDPKLTPKRTQDLIQAKLASGENLRGLGILVARAIAMGAGFVQQEPEDGEGKAEPAAGT